MRRPSPHDLHWPPCSAAVGALLGEESSQLIMKQNVSQGLGYGHHGLYVRPESAQPITSIFRQSPSNPSGTSRQMDLQVQLKVRAVEQIRMALHACNISMK